MYMYIYIGFNHLCYGVWMMFLHFPKCTSLSCSLTECWGFSKPSGDFWRSSKAFDDAVGLCIGTRQAVSMVPQSRCRSA